MNRSPARIFISSTCHDLKSEREALRYLLYRHWQLQVFASDHTDFPISANHHSYTVCRRNIRSVDLVILIIDQRYGGIFNDTEDPPISITRQEVRDAAAANIPIWTFVRNDTWEERHQFKSLVSELRKTEPSTSLDEAYARFSAGDRKPRVQNRFVYDFVDEVTRRETDNWIFSQFFGLTTLLDTVESQLPSFLARLYGNQLYQGLPPSVENPSSMIDDFVEQSPKYRELNLKSLNLQLAAIGRPSTLVASIMDDFGALRDRALNAYSAEMVQAIGSTTPASGDSVDIFVADTSLEALSADAWQSDPYHQRVIRHSELLARKHDLKNCHYTRVIIIYDPARVFWDEDWRKSVAYLLNFHKSRGIRLGIALRDGISSPLVDRLLNFYLLREEVVAVYDQLTGMAFEFSPSESSLILSDYVALRDELIEICGGEASGFWVSENMDADVFLSELQNLLGFGDPDEP